MLTQTELVQACMSGNRERVAQWLSYHIGSSHQTLSTNDFARDRSVAFVLATVARHGRLSCVELLLQSGAVRNVVNAVNARVAIGCTQWLLPAETTSTGWPSDKATPLYLASAAGHLSVIDCLLRQPGIDVNKGSYRTEQTPLQVACQNGHTAVVGRLLQEQSVQVDHTFLGLWCHDSTARREICQLLLEDARVGVVPHGNATLCHSACKRHDDALLSILLQHPKTRHLIDAVNDQGCTALYLAAGGPLNDDVVQCLLGHGAAVNTPCDGVADGGQTALHRAVKSARRRQVTLLLDCDDDVNVNAATTATGRTPLMEACHEYWLTFADGGDMRDIVQQLLHDARLNVNQTDHNGRTILMHASAMGLTWMVELLIQQHSIQVNISDKQGRTALHLACAGNHLRCVQLLIQQERACLVSPRDVTGATPLDHALVRGGTELVYFAMREHHGWQHLTEVR